MTYKRGLTAGVVLGIIAWTFVHGGATFAPAPELAAGFLRMWAATFVILAIVTVFKSAWQGRAAFTPTIDGLIYGFVAIFDLFWVTAELVTGNLPIP